MFGARIDGTLDLTSATIPLPVVLANCVFVGPVLLVGAQITFLVIVRSLLSFLNAEFVTSSGSIFLEHTRAISVKLGGAKIGGDLNCNGAMFGASSEILSSLGGRALFCDRTQVSGNVWLSEGFRAYGTVSFIGVQIGGDLACGGATISAAGDKALDGDSMRVAGSTFLREARVIGQVRLVGSSLGGDLDCKGAVLENSGETALIADQAQIAETAFLSDNFVASGEVRLIGSAIGELCCSEGKFNNHQSRCLTADGAKVARSVFLNNQFQADGEVRFLSADVGGRMVCDGTFHNPEGYALVADGIRVRGAALLRPGFNVDGEVRFVEACLQSFEITAARFAENSGLNAQGAKIASSFIWKDLSSNHPASLNLNGASVGAFGDDEQSWPRTGKLFLDGFNYEHIAEGPTDVKRRLQWLERPPEKFILQPYQQLAKVLRNMGDDAGSRTVLIAMENSRRTQGNLTKAELLISLALRLTIAYGYAPFRALWYIGFFVILGTLLFFWGYNVGVITSALKNPPAQAQPFNAFVYSLETFLPLVDLQQKKYWCPDPNSEPHLAITMRDPLTETKYTLVARIGRFLRVYLWIHTLAGWFFTSMFVAGITGLVRRN